MKSIPRVFAWLAVCFCAFTQTTHAGEPDLQTDLQALLETFHETYGFPGMTAAYVADDGVVESFAVGLADVEANVSMTSETRMLAASIGKTIWGALALALEADGLLSRSDPIARHLGDQPWFARVPNADDITIAHLLTHTSGLSDHVHRDGVAAELIALGREDLFDPAALVPFVLHEPALFEAGSAWAYTDTGYVLLGLVFEAATGQDVFSLADEYFLRPLGLTATDPSDTSTIEGIAVGYTIADNPFGLAPRTMDDGGRLTWNPVVEWTGGGFVSTSAELALWGHALFSGAAMDGDYLGALLNGVAIHPNAPGVYYGAGVAIYQETPHGPVYGHGGWIPGYVSSLRHYADHDLTIAFQINSDVGVADDNTDLVPNLERSLADLLIAGEPHR